MASSITAFRNFKINILVRFGVLIILIFALSFTILQTDLWTLILWLSIAILLFVVEFIRYVEKFKDQFLYFLQAINQEDFSLSFPRSTLQNQDERISSILNEIMSRFRQLRAEKEFRHQYLKTVIEQINIGIISYNQEGEITLMNRAAGKMLQKLHFRKIDTLKKINPDLYREVKDLSSEKRSLIKLIRGNRILNISLQATEIKLDEGFEKLITLQDIRTELDEQEVESWQKLVRVINHEIMNSVIPISTLASVLDQMLSDPDRAGQDSDVMQDVAEGIRTIEHRSQGLAGFVKATKSLTQIPIPVFKNFKVEMLFNRIKKLLMIEMEKQNIELIIQPPGENIRIRADFELIEQVLLNLIKNAAESYGPAHHGEKVIHVNAETLKEGNQIIVKDNGVGIDKDTLDKVFIPFFTTKKEGSGIGLSLSRQIMRLHKGRLDVHSIPGKGSTFVLIF